MGGGSRSPSPVGDLANVLNNCRIEPPSVPGPSAAAAAVACAMPNYFGGHPPSSGSYPPWYPHHKHKLKWHLKIKHKHHEHRHGGKKERHRSPHCHHKNKHMHIEAPLDSELRHHGLGPHPHPRRRRHHHMQQNEHEHGHCCLHGHHPLFTQPMCAPLPVPPPHN